MIHLKDVVKDGMRTRFDELRAMGIRTVMITGDNPLTARAIATEAGVDDFLAEATPEDKMALIKKEQSGGRLIAMTGDGTNDAPALAQADVGVAMNTGTQAAKEAGNMVDLDSDPTKLIEIVEIGKQLLITRGALTTFSVANDVAKYFAIIPAMFMGVFPVLDDINIMRLESPRSAILAAVIFNALIIVGLIPLALRGVKFRAESAVTMLRRNLLIYGLGGIIAPFVGIKLIDLLISAPRSLVMLRRQLPAAIGMLIIFTVLTGVVYPARRHGDRSDRLPRQGRGLARRGRRPGRRLLADRPAVHRARVLPPATVGGGRGLRRLGQLGVQPRADEPRLPRHRRRARRRLPRRRTASTTARRCRSMPSPPRPRVSIRTSRSPTPRCRHHASPRRAGLDIETVLELVDDHTAGRDLGFLGERGVNVLELNIALDAIEAQPMGELGTVRSRAHPSVGTDVGTA